MTRQTFQPPVKTSWGIVALLIVSTALFAAPPRPSAEAKKDKTAADAEKSKEQFRREAEQVVRSIDLEIHSDDKWIKVERIEKPLLFYSDPTREDDRGSVWGWAPKGRPVALLELYQKLDNRTRWNFTICNTSGGKLRTHRADAPWWRENDSDAELKDIPGAPTPSAKAPVRQRQLKLLAQKFTGYELWRNARHELRLLKQPLHTYRDEAGGLLDGGLFTLANGTNPEIMLFIEARVSPKNHSKGVWQFMVGRLAQAELHLNYDGKEVFDAPHGNKLAGPSQPYWLGYINTALDADPRKP